MEIFMRLAGVESAKKEMEETAKAAKLAKETYRKKMGDLLYDVMKEKDPDRKGLFAKDISVALHGILSPMEVFRALDNQTCMWGVSPNYIQCIDGRKDLRFGVLKEKGTVVKHYAEYNPVTGELVPGGWTCQKKHEGCLYVWAK